MCCQLMARSHVPYLDVRRQDRFGALEGRKATKELAPMLEPIEKEVLSWFEEVCVGGAGSEEVAPILVELKDAVRKEREEALKQNFASVRKQALDLKDQCVQQAKVCVL